MEEDEAPKGDVAGLAPNIVDCVPEPNVGAVVAGLPNRELELLFCPNVDVEALLFPNSPPPATQISTGSVARRCSMIIPHYLPVDQKCSVPMLQIQVVLRTHYSEWYWYLIRILTVVN